jgi:ABC-type branched-subunit amino acid transport system ATPase component
VTGPRSTTSPSKIGRDEVFGFMEPNGTGKTTTVRTLSTLLVSTSGPTTVAGIPLTPANVVEIRRRDRQSEERHKRTFHRCGHCSAHRRFPAPDSAADWRRGHG